MLGAWGVDTLHSVYCSTQKEYLLTLKPLKTLVFMVLLVNGVAGAWLKATYKV